MIQRPPFAHSAYHRAPHRGAAVGIRTVTRQGFSGSWLLGVVSLCLAAPCINAHAPNSNNQVHSTTPSPSTAVQDQCLPDGHAYLRARISGTINAELSWSDAQLRCTGSARPDAHGLRLRFSQADSNGMPLVLLFGIGELAEGESGKALPVNVTVMREGSGEFYATQGDNKCTIDDLHQERLTVGPRRERSYRVVARGFCTQPARALNGSGSVLLTRFDFAGRVDFSDDNAAPASSSST